MPYGYGFGFGEAMPVLPPPEALRAMTDTQLYQLMHKLTLVVVAAQRDGKTGLASLARQARNDVAAIYTASGKDFTALDRAILTMDKLTRAVGEAAREVVEGVAGTAGRAVGKIGMGTLPILPLAGLALAAYLFVTGKAGRRRGRW